MVAGIAGKRRVLMLMTLLHVTVFILSCRFIIKQPAENYAVKNNAVQIAIQAQQVIGERLIGEEYTPITTTLGPYDAKRLSLHPDFAAVVVEMLHQAGVKSGDHVAVNLSGSFPALNIAVMAAVRAMEAQPVIVSSVGASTWGANRPEYTWLDMEQDLVAAGMWPWKSAAASMGGGYDRGLGLTPEGLENIRAAIERSGVPALICDDLYSAIMKRMALYRQAAGGMPKVLINVGGNHIIFGKKGHAAPLRQGLTCGYRPSLATVDGLAREFVNNGRPVVHMINIARLAAHYGIRPDSPPETSRVFYSFSMPAVIRFIIISWLLSSLAILRLSRQARGGNHEAT